VKRTIKIAAWALLALVCVVALAVATIMFINRSDRPESAAARALDVSLLQLPAVPDADNGFVYLLGLGAGPDSDPVALGLQRVAWSHAVTKDSDNVPGSFPTADSAPVLSYPPDMAAIRNQCQAVDRACAALLEKRAGAIDAWLAAQAFALERYQTMLTRPQWRETTAFDVRLPSPDYGVAIDGQHLQMLQAWRLAGKGDARGVKALLDADTAFWRMTMASADSMLAKTVAAVALKRQFQWGNLALRRLPAARAGEALPDQWRAELSPLERSLLRACAGEYQAVVTTTRFFRSDVSRVSDDTPGEISMYDVATALLMPTFQRQDYKNRYAALATAVASSLDVPYRAYPGALLQARRMVARSADGAFEHALYNWPGNALFASGSPDHTGFGTRAADVEGARRLALLAAALRQGGVVAEQVRERLGATALREPYEGRPFLWDPATGSIVFVGLEPGPRGRHLMVY
jgi:hypothetical protein